MRGRVVLFLFVLLFASQRVEAFIAINEILADPATTISGDANADGVRNSNDDEFIELVNAGATSVDISNWYLKDATSTRHIFSAGTLLDPYTYLVVFGGGNPQLTGIDWLTASSGLLSLNNTSETVTLFNAANQLIDQIVYGSLANNDQSIVRSPEATGDLALHSLAQGGLYSPGTGGIRAPINASTVPEPVSLLTFALGSLALLRRKP